MSDQLPLQPDEATADPVDEELVAYLDGELDAESVRRLEERLGSDMRLRQRLRELQAAWDLLEELPTTEADAAFTHTTVSMVAFRASQETHRRRWLVPAAWGALACVGAIAAAAAGYWSVDYFVSAPERQFARDLPVIERMDMYRVAESVQFLRQLANEGLFDEDPSHAP